MAKFDFKFKLLGIEISMFLAIQAIGLWVGSVLLQAGQIETLPTEQALSSFVIAFAIALVMVVLALKFLASPFSFGIFFAVLIFIGAQIVFAAFLPLIWSIIAAAAVAAVRFVKPTVITHNIAIFLTVAGVSAQLGLLLPVPAILIILFGLSIYDYWAVFKSKHMVTWFKSMLERSAPFAIIVPERPEAMAASVQAVSARKLKRKDRSVIMLGTGDLAFPTVFAVSALSAYGPLTALAIIAGSIVGIFVNHYYLIKKFRAIPALPAIAFFSALGFFISLALLA